MNYWVQDQTQLDLPTFERLTDVSIPSLVMKNINDKGDQLLFLSTNPKLTLNCKMSNTSHTAAY